MSQNQKKKKVRGYDQKCDPESYQVQDWLGVDPDTVTREELILLHNKCEPRGSGDLWGMGMSCVVIHLLVKLRGFEPLTYEEIKKPRDEAEKARRARWAGTSLISETPTNKGENS